MVEATGAAPLWPCGCVMGDPACRCGDSGGVPAPADPPEPLTWKSALPSPYNHSDLPIEHRLYLAAHDSTADALDGWGEGDGCHDEIRGLLAEHDYAHSVQVADALGLVGDWDEDDVTEAIANAAAECRALRAALDAARADVERLRRELVDSETAREHYASATGVLAAERDEARAEAERLSAQRADALAAADGWESDSAAFSTVPGFRRYVVDGVREALGATDGD